MFIAITIVLIIILGLGYYFFKKLSSNNAHNTSSEINNSIGSFNQNDTTFAIKQADDILARDPKNVDALIMKATAVAQQGSLFFQEKTYGQQAIGIALEALSVDPKSDEAWRIIGYANETMQRYDVAHVAYAKALAINPNNAQALSQDAHAWDLQGDPVKAEAGYTSAITIDSTLDQPHMGLGRVLAEQGKRTDALNQFKWVYINSENLRTRAEAALSAGTVETNSANSLAYMQDATIVDPTYAEGWAGLATQLFNEGLATSSSMTPKQRIDAANQSLAYLGKAINLNPTQSQAHIQLAIELATFGKNSQAIEVLKGVKYIIPQDITLDAGSKTRALQQANKILAMLTKK